MAKKKTASRYLLCVKNANYPASLEVRKVYRAIPDKAAAERHFVRVIDESGDDYLYPKNYFIAIALPRAAARTFSRV